MNTSIASNGSVLPIRFTSIRVPNRCHSPRQQSGEGLLERLGRLAALGRARNSGWSSRLNRGGLSRPSPTESFDGQSSGSGSITSNDRRQLDRASDQCSSIGKNYSNGDDCSTQRRGSEPALESAALGRRVRLRADRGNKEKEGVGLTGCRRLCVATEI